MADRGGLDLDNLRKNALRGGDNGEEDAGVKWINIEDAVVVEVVDGGQRSSDDFIWTPVNNGDDNGDDNGGDNRRRNQKEDNNGGDNGRRNPKEDDNGGDNGRRNPKEDDNGGRNQNGDDNGGDNGGGNQSGGGDYRGELGPDDLPPGAPERGRRRN